MPKGSDPYRKVRKARIAELKRNRENRGPIDFMIAGIPDTEGWQDDLEEHQLAMAEIAGIPTTENDIERIREKKGLPVKKEKATKQKSGLLAELKAGGMPAPGGSYDYDVKESGEILDMAEGMNPIKKSIKGKKRIRKS